MTATERKTSLAVTVKSEAKGEALVRFGTPDGMTPDLDGDITGPNAYPEGGQVVVSPFGHTSLTAGAIPAGRATVHRDGTADIKFFLDTPTGLATFATLKGLGPIAQYSYGFAILEEGPLTDAMQAAGGRRYLKRLDVWELSPVVRGAGGAATQTLAIKCDGCATQPDTTAIAATREAERFAFICEKSAVPAGLGLPERFRPALAFFLKRLAIPGSRAPSVRVVSLASLPADATGQYLHDKCMVLVGAGLDDHTTLAVLAHEAVHHYEALKGWTHDDGFAYAQERILLNQWHTEHERLSA